ncbi:hypothetical protein EHS25_001918 [Saitozyma podzolica]|uniref:Uncharacterized protein n=1 Tax=Saitozyma podzolica TaxID=1890683 RepID=A0A427YFR2_9TREE|nr:hypothetical protein EHS25_001918 [Saitozyma podzolica]
METTINNVLWSAKPAGTRGDMLQESTLDRATLERLQVRLEPLITVSQGRNDIRITRSASSGLSSADIDITIVSLASQESQTATLPLAATEDDSVAERTTKLVQKHLNAVAS